MDTQAVADSMRVFVDNIKQGFGYEIDKVALVPAYSGAIAGRYTLLMSIPGLPIFPTKQEFIIRQLFEMVPKEQRKVIAGVVVFDSVEEFNRFINGQWREEQPFEASQPIEVALAA